MQYLKKISMSFVILMLALMLDSCSTKQAAINDLQRLSYDLRDNSRNYTVREWRGAADRFVKIRKRISKHDYTVSEREEIGRLEGQCAKYMVQGAKDGALDYILGLGKEIQGILDGIGYSN